MKLRFLAGLLGVAAAAAAFSAAAQPPPGCFFVRDVGDRTVGGPHTLYFKVKDRAHMHAIAYFQVETAGACNTAPDSSSQHAAFRISSTVLAAGDAAMICKPGDLWITAASPCPVASIRMMSPKDVAALPEGIRP
ncbi:MAG TPA: hypothetical protein VFE10_10410 [Phenylobacterium sp.]|jgi:hypothetical protein|nr:hypothetical protein [Phenylobacterium sp.]